MYGIVKGTPVVGHVVAAGHAIAGGMEGAEIIAIGATKSTIVAAAGAVGLLCGPGAPACAAGLTVATSNGWDAAEGGIRGEKVGSIKAWDDLVHGRSDLGQRFDIVGGTIIEAGSAALGAKAARAAKAAKKVAPEGP